MKKKEPICKQTIIVIVFMVILGVGVILSNTIVPWLGEINRGNAVINIIDSIIVAVNNHVTNEHNELGNIFLNTFKENRGIGKSEHMIQTQMLNETLIELREIKQLLKNGST